MERFRRAFEMVLCLLALFPLGVSISYGEVYCLNDGSCLSGSSPAPLDDTFLSLETLNGPVEIDRNEILLYRSDEELKELFEHAKSTVDENDLDGHNKLAWWCRRKGLYEEMFGLYDEILGRDPKNRGANRFIAEMAATIDYRGFTARLDDNPRSIRELFESTARDGATLARIGESILARAPEGILLPLLLERLSSRSERQSGTALEILKRTRPASAREALVTAALFNKSDTLRQQALDVLCLYDDDRILYPFIATLRVNARNYRLNAMRGLARLADPRASGALIANLAPSKSSAAGRGARAHIFVGTQRAAVTGFDPQVATSAAIAAPVISTLQEGVTLEVEVFGAVISTVRSDERRQIARLLRDLNGIDYGTDFLLWNEWWAQNKNKILGRETRSKAQ